MCEIKLYNGDFISKLDNVENESIDLILTDIPYNISKKNGLGGFDKKNNRKGTISLVGAGPGDPNLLTLKAINVIKNANLVIADRLIPKEIFCSNVFSE